MAGSFVRLTFAVRHDEVVHAVLVVVDRGDVPASLIRLRDGSRGRRVLPGGLLPLFPRDALRVRHTCAATEPRYLSFLRAGAPEPMMVSRVWSRVSGWANHGEDRLIGVDVTLRHEVLGLLQFFLLV
jgi:hypothetical protein